MHGNAQIVLNRKHVTLLCAGNHSASARALHPDHAGASELSGGQTAQRHSTADSNSHHYRSHQNWYSLIITVSFFFFTFQCQAIYPFPILFSILSHFLEYIHLLSINSNLIDLPLCCSGLHRHHHSIDKQCVRDPTSHCGHNVNYSCC